MNSIQVQNLIKQIIPLYIMLLNISIQLLFRNPDFKAILHLRSIQYHYFLFLFHLILKLSSHHIQHCRPNEFSLLEQI